jgi:hypothetical protein
MAAAIDEEVGAVTAARGSERPEDRERRALVRRHLETFSVDRFRERFLGAVHHLVPSR